MDKCRECGHIRYPGDLFEGRCDACERWANARIAELEDQLAEQKEWVNDLADLNVENEAKLAVVRDIAKSVIFDSHSEVVDKMCEIRDVLSDPVSRENGDIPDERKEK